MWLNELKIALIEKNTEKLNKLMETLPKLEKQEDITTALYLLKEATSLLESLKEETGLSMLKMKKHRDFMHATQAPLPSKLDINS